MVRNLFSDLDGTLYEEGINIRDIEAIRRIEALGTKFHIATGRSIRAAKRAIDGAFDFNGYFICENGGSIYNSRGELIHKRAINDELVNEVIAFLKEINTFNNPNTAMYFKNDGETILDEPNDVFARFDADDLIIEGYSSRGVYNNTMSNLGIASDNPEELEYYERRLKEKFGDRLTVHFSSVDTVDIMSKGVTKFSGMEFICERMGDSIEDTAAIGDSLNDFEMIKNAGIGACMSGGDPKCREVADHIVESVGELVEILTGSVENLDRIMEW